MELAVIAAVLGACVGVVIGFLIRAHMAVDLFRMISVAVTEGFEMCDGGEGFDTNTWEHDKYLGQAWSLGWSLAYYRDAKKVRELLEK